ncbi:putative acetyltransferase [Nocardioides thalensis]|uniref:Putative acetyltransferase n=1 Tax=Nocardioides thalensis TaxID=1914755 RepID=A0A853C1A4_9ACTN|nr:GNAT family N-acetyltransferase [Nocardioides thalensis]NYJ01064.1 putative acetyltransferase [Nocardioides thalensis]
MTALVRPDARLARAWAAMMADFGGWDEAHGSGYWWAEEPPPYGEGDCAAFVDLVLAHEPPADPPSTRVGSTFFWIAEGSEEEPGELVGFLNTRHRLNDFLLEQGGHIGYSVRPSARRRGHASRALALAVRDAGQRLGIDRVLVTCDDDNLPSAATIERNGGVLEDVRGIKRRYWIDARTAAVTR